MILFNPGKAVGYVIDRARGVRRIRPAAQTREVRQIHAWDAVRDQFPLREYVWIIEAAWHCRLCARVGPIKEVRRVHRYQHDVLTGGDQNLIHHSGIQGPRIVEGAGLIGAMEKLRRAVGIAVEWLVLQICVIHRPKLEALLLRKVYIHAHGILALVNSVKLRGKPVAIAADEGSEVGDRPRIQNTDAIGAKLV